MSKKQDDLNELYVDVMSQFLGVDPKSVKARIEKAADLKERVRDVLGAGRLKIVRLTNLSLPPAERRYWDLRLTLGKKEATIWEGRPTHDLNRINEEIRANKKSILGRMRETLRKHSPKQEQRSQKQKLEQGP